MLAYAHVNEELSVHDISGNQNNQDYFYFIFFMQREQREKLKRQFDFQFFL